MISKLKRIYSRGTKRKGNDGGKSAPSQDGKNGAWKEFDSIQEAKMPPSDMYSDSSSTTSSESSENFPGYIPIPMSDEEAISASYPGSGGDRTKMYQAYKGQLKLSAYVNYGLLTVHVIMGRHIKSKAKPTCDSYIKLSLVPDDSKRTLCKTEVIYDTNNPLYDEKFSFELLDEDKPKRLFISVWNKDSERGQCEFLGCMSFGINHILTKLKTIHGWYYLLNADIGRKKHLQVTDRKHLSERSHNCIPAVNQDVLWMEPCSIVIKRGSGKSGFGFTINGACPVRVCRVEPGSPADMSGVKPGDCIVRIEGLNVSRSTCDSVARIIKHCLKRIILEVQRPKKVETTFPINELDRSPRQPLCSSIPFQENQAPDDMVISPWKPPPTNGRRTLDTVIEEETPPTSPEKGFETLNYGWIDRSTNYNGEEDIYVEPDEIQAQVLRIPQDPPALPPNHPTLTQDRLHRNQGGPPLKKKLESMGVSPWKPPKAHDEIYSEDEDPYMPLNGVKHHYRETDLDEGSERGFEWDYSDTRLSNSIHEETINNYGWIDSHLAPRQSSSHDSGGYSSATLPRSMKLGANKSRSRTSLQRDVEPIYAQTEQVMYRDDMALRKTTGAGAHGYQGDHRDIGYHGNQRDYQDAHDHSILSSGQSVVRRQYQRSLSSHTGVHRSHSILSSSQPVIRGQYQRSLSSSSTLPHRKKVSFRDFN